MKNIQVTNALKHSTDAEHMMLQGYNVCVFKVIPHSVYPSSLPKLYRRKKDRCFQSNPSMYACQQSSENLQTQKRTVFKVIPHSMYANQQSSEFIIYAIKKKYKCWILSYFLSITAPCFYTIGPLIAGNYWVFVLRDLIIVYQPPSFGDLPIIKLTIQPAQFCFL